MIRFDAKTGRIFVQVDKENTSDALKMKELMQHPGYDALMRQIDVLRDQFTKEIEDDSLKRAKREGIAIKGGMLNMARQIKDLCPKFVEAVKTALETEKGVIEHGSPQ